MTPANSDNAHDAVEAGADAARAAATKASDTASDAVAGASETAADVIGSAKKTATESIDDAEEKGHAAVTRTFDAVNGMVADTTETARKYPLRSVLIVGAIAAVLGFVAGAVIRR